MKWLALVAAMLLATPVVAHEPQGYVIVQTPRRPVLRGVGMGIRRIVIGRQPTYYLVPVYQVHGLPAAHPTVDQTPYDQDGQ